MCQILSKSVGNFLGMRTKWQTNQQPQLIKLPLSSWISKIHRRLPAPECIDHIAYILASIILHFEHTNPRSK